MKKTIIALTLGVCTLSSCKQSQPEPQWESIFNGKDLTGWTVKVTGYPCGENFANTFRVEDGVLKVVYDGYDEFNNRFGHIYTDKEYSYYKLRLQYRFIGEQIKGGPGWAVRNSGAMLHCPDPNTMHLDQDFPVSIEGQFLGGNGVDERPTGNICTPGTEVFIANEKYEEHCATSNSKTYHGDQWVTAEFVVYGDSLAHHIIEGDTVLTYTNMTIGGGGVSPDPGYKAGTPLGKGRIALQSESHPVEFKNIEIMDLSPLYEKK